MIQEREGTIDGVVSLAGKRGSNPGHKRKVFTFDMHKDTSFTVMDGKAENIGRDAGRP